MLSAGRTSIPTMRPVAPVMATVWAWRGSPSENQTS
jgi:hypothetical protein